MMGAAKTSNPHNSRKIRSHGVVTVNKRGYTLNAYYRVLEVCRHVINYSNENDISISNLKLQKLLYFIQAEFLLDYSFPCFIEDIEAWNLGPVVREAYREYKRYGANPIPKIIKIAEYNSHSHNCIIYTPFKDDKITDEHKGVIDNLIDYFADYTASELIDITHAQRPWINAYNSDNRIITIYAIEEYFNEIVKRQ